MPRRVRANASVITVLVLMVAIEVFSLRANTLGIVVIGGMSGLALITVAARADLRLVALGAAYLSAFTLTWNGWFVGPVRPGDALVLVILLCLGIVAPSTSFRSPPWWVKQLVGAIALGVLLIVLFPPSPSYLSQRVMLDAGGGPLPVKTFDVSLSNVGIGAKFIIAVAAIPVAFAGVALLDRRAVRRLAIAFTTGTSLSGLAAFIDHTHVASIGSIITGLPNASDRQIGFAFHPNFLAAGLVLAIPFACWLLVSYTRWEQRLGAICLTCMLLGVLASGSRGGAVCSVGGVLLSFACLPRSRKQLPAIVVAVLAGVVAIVALVPSFGATILRVTRLAGNPNSAGSDQVRAMVGAQGVRDFYHSLFHGIGLQASTDASQVYLQELAAGGLLLFLGMQVYMLGAAWTALRLIPVDPLAAAVLASIGATLALNIFEADLTDRFYYVPEAILFAMMVRRRQDALDAAAEQEAAAKATPPAPLVPRHAAVST